MQVNLSVIVPAYNEQELIAGCLEALLHQTLDQNMYEIIVVDNNSTDQTARIALSEGVRVEKEQKKGYVHALRRGIDASQAEIIALTDADCHVPPDWLQKILADFSASQEVIAVGGKLSFYDLHPVYNAMLRLILFFNQALPGNNLAVKREAINRIGGIDPKVNLTVDYWLTLKLRKVGKLKIDRKLVVSTSGRRFRGSFSSDIRYFLNVISLMLASKPLFFDFPDVRERTA